MIKTIRYLISKILTRDQINKYADMYMYIIFRYRKVMCNIITHNIIINF